jgi:hypothetical protein
MLVINYEEFEEEEIDPDDYALGESIYWRIIRRSNPRR